MARKPPSSKSLLIRVHGLDVPVKIRYRADRRAWFMDYTTPTGIRMRPQLYASNIAEAQREAEDAFTMPDFADEFLPRKAVESRSRGASLKTVLDYYTDTYLIASGKSDRTIVSATGILRDFELFCRSVKRLARIDSITRQTVDEWAVDLAKRGNSQTTIANKLGMVRAAINAAVESGIIPESPIDKWKLPDTDTGEIYPLEPRELAEFLAHIKEVKPTIYNITAWMAYTGNRPSDACALRWQQVSLDTRTVERKQVKVKRLAQYQLSADALAVLQSEEQRAITRRGGEVFTDGNVDPFTVNSVYRAMTRAQEGRKRVVTPKDLRHTFGYIMANYARCPLPVLQVLMGHTDIATTMRYVRNADAIEYLGAYEKLLKKR